MLDISDWIDLVVLLFNFIVGILYLLVFVIEDDLKFPLETEEKFEYWINEIDNINTYLIFGGVLLILLAFRLINILSIKLPIFSSIFFTIRYAMKDLLNVIICIVVILSGFCIGIALMYGTGVDDLNDFGKSFLTFFYICVNPIAFRDIEHSFFDDFSVSFFLKVLYVIVIVIIAFTLVNMLVSIIIIKYRFMRSGIQENSEAYARIIAKESKEYLNKWVNLFLCRKPADRVGANRTDRNMESSLNLWNKFLMNALNIWDGIKPKDKEERDEELNAEVIAIKKEKALERKLRRKNFSGKELKRHTDVLKRLGIFVAYYLLGNVLIVLMQLEISKSYEQTVVKQYLETK